MIWLETMLESGAVQAVLAVNPLLAILVIPAVAVIVLAVVPGYRLGATLNMLASGLTFMAGVSLLFAERQRSAPVRQAAGNPPRAAAQTEEEEFVEPLDLDAE